MGTNKGHFSASGRNPLNEDAVRVSGWSRAVRRVNQEVGPALPRPEPDSPPRGPRS